MATIITADIMRQKKAEHSQKAFDQLVSKLKDISTWENYHFNFTYTDHLLEDWQVAVLVNCGYTLTRCSDKHKIEW